MGQNDNHLSLKYYTIEGERERERDEYTIRREIWTKRYFPHWNYTQHTSETHIYLLICFGDIFIIQEKVIRRKFYWNNEDNGLLGCRCGSWNSSTA